jgi:hypothetical protein
VPVIPIEAARRSQASPDGSKPRWDRAEASAVFAEAEQARGKVSQRQFARDAGVPRTSLRHWEARSRRIDEDPAVVAFFETPPGLSVLHHIDLAAHLVLTQLEPAGERAVSQFLRLARLDRFIAASIGKQHAVAMDIQQAIISYEEQERPRLAALRPVDKPIVICLDENYHSEVCLIAQEPVSNFLVLETYALDCKAETWATGLRQAFVQHRVALLAGSGDGGSGLDAGVDPDVLPDACVR